MRRVIGRVVSAAVVMAVVAACSATSSDGTGESEDVSVTSETTPEGDDATDVSDETFAVAIGIDLDTLDPVQQRTTTVMNVLNYAVEALTLNDKEGILQSNLATEWEFSDDGLTLTFTLRDDVVFHDGTPFNADAVKFNYERLMDPDVNAPIRSIVESVDSVEVIDATHVALHLNAVDPDLPRELSMPIAGILSPESVTAEGNTYENVTHPVGTGPYIFDNFKPGTSIEFTRNDNYWNGAPYYKTAEFLIIPEGNAREAALMSGQAQMIMSPPVTDLDALRANPEIEVITAPSHRTIYVAMNTKRAPFDNKLVRQAFNYAVDKEAIAKAILFDTVNLSKSPWSSVIANSCEVGSYEYDPDRARELLAEAGVSDLKITFGFPTGRYLQDKQFAEAIAANLRDVGVDVDMVTADWPTYQSNTMLEDGPYDMHILGWGGTALTAVGASEVLRTGAPLNGAFYSNPEADALLKEADSELDADRRADLYCEVQKLFWDDAPWIFLWSQTLILAHASDVTGVDYNPEEQFRTWFAHPAS